MTRDGMGVLELRLHTGGGSLVWGEGPHTELPYCFADVAADRDNRVVVLTGTGKDFCAKIDDSWADRPDPPRWDKLLHHGIRLLRNHLDIDVPMVAAVEGRATVHPELAVLCDIVIASDEAVFADQLHFVNGIVAGDGVHLIWPALLGPNRGRYFLLTGEKLTAAEARTLGVVGEVVAPGKALQRAQAVARKLAGQPDLTLRYSRQAMTHQLKRTINDGLTMGLALEGLGACTVWPTGKTT